MKRATTLAFVFLASIFHSTASAVTIEMVTIGNPGNAADTRYDATGIGSVDHIYRIGKYEVTAGQYTEFLNAVAKDDAGSDLLYYEPPVDFSFGYGANIQQAGSSPYYSYSVAADWANRPVNYMNFWCAARFTNWLHNGQPTGPLGPDTTEGGAYHDVGNQALFGRNVGAMFFIPTHDEWYKAAYHDKAAGLAAAYFDYPTGTNAVPGNDITEATNPGNNANYNLGSPGFAIGSPYWRTVVGEFELSESPYGTFDQGGNLIEWNETAVETFGRGAGGAGFFNDANSLHASFRDSGGLPNFKVALLGFRVASIPEPGTVASCVSSVVMIVLRRRKRNLGVGE